MLNHAHNEVCMFWFMFNVIFLGLVQWVLGGILALCLLLVYGLGQPFTYQALAWWTGLVLLAELIHEWFFRRMIRLADEEDPPALRCAERPMVARALLYAPFWLGLITVLPWLYMAVTGPGGGAVVYITPAGVLMIGFGWAHFFRRRRSRQAT